ncbi:SanA/YdcF family protein [Panacagrimonas sp.]|uniref:SanA/YdcF family protein n=1 Tax=Panacagrimonas sp. TaxID=2480088 RepID=UPI003B51DB7D
MLFWWALAAFALTVLLANRWVINSTDSRLYDNFALLPDNDVGIVLGTSAYTRKGQANPQFYARVDAAVQLYRLGKIKHLIVSGANPDSTYNEPRRMWQELTKAGVPAEAITMDFAGFRTFDTLSRAKHVFGLRRFTLVTQKYHAYRALFLGKKMGMSPVAFVAPIGPTGEPGNRHPPREVFARVKAVLDLFVLRTQPKFLGQPEAIQIRPPGSESAPSPLPVPQETT